MKPIVQVPIKFGVIAGLLGGLIAIVLYYMGRHPFLFNPIFDYRVLLFPIFMFFTLKEFRDYYQEGVMYFAQGMICCLVFTTSYAIVGSAIIWIFGEINDEFVTTFIQLFKEQAKGLSENEIKQMGKENFERNLKAVESTNAFWMAWNYFKQCYWIGLFFSLIISAVLRRQPKI